VGGRTRQLCEAMPPGVQIQYYSPHGSGWAFRFNAGATCCHFPRGGAGTHLQSTANEMQWILCGTHLPLSFFIVRFYSFCCISMFSIHIAYFLFT